MASRRQEKVASVVRETVSNVIQNRLSDPRLEGFVSVTKVDISPDLRNADVFISIMGTNDTIRKKSFIVIEHATRYIQKLVGQTTALKFCPHLHFYEDENLKKTLQIMKLIDEAAKQSTKKNNVELQDQD